MHGNLTVVVELLLVAAAVGSWPSGCASTTTSRWSWPAWPWAPRSSCRTSPSTRTSCCASPARSSSSRPPWPPTSRRLRENLVPVVLLAVPGHAGHGVRRGRGAALGARPGLAGGPAPGLHPGRHRHHRGDRRLPQGARAAAPGHDRGEREPVQRRHRARGLHDRARGDRARALRPRARAPRAGLGHRGRARRAGSPRAMRRRPADAPHRRPPDGDHDHGDRHLRAPSAAAEAAGRLADPRGGGGGDHRARGRVGRR